MLGLFSRQRDRAYSGYRDFVRDGVGLPSLWNKLEGQIFLGGDSFIQRARSSLSADQSLDEIPRAQRRPLAKPLASYRAEFASDLHTGMALAYLSGDYPMKAIAQVFDVHCSIAGSTAASIFCGSGMPLCFNCHFFATTKGR